MYEKYRAKIILLRHIKTIILLLALHGKENSFLLVIAYHMNYITLTIFA